MSRQSTPPLGSLTVLLFCCFAFPFLAKHFLRDVVERSRQRQILLQFYHRSSLATLIWYFRKLAFRAERKSFCVFGFVRQWCARKCVICALCYFLLSNAGRAQMSWIFLKTFGKQVCEKVLRHSQDWSNFVCGTTCHIPKLPPLVSSQSGDLSWMRHFQLNNYFISDTNITSNIW